MSSSESNYDSPVSPAIRPEQVDTQAATVLSTIQRVRNLIEAEVNFANRRITRSVCRQDTLVRNHVEFFERKSLSNITTSSTHCISELPSYPQRETQGRVIASEPASPGLSDSSSKVSTEQTPIANMAEEPNANTSLERLGHTRPDDEFDGFEEPTPQWDLFVQRAGVSLETMETRLTKFTSDLNNEHNPVSTLDKKVMLNKVNKFIDELETFKNEYHAITMEEQVTAQRMQQVNNSLESMESDLIRVQIQVDTAETNSQTPPIDMDTHLLNMVSAVQSVANSPVLPLPIFYGKVTTYAAFKKSFKCLIQKVAGPKTLWATHLANSMRGDAKKYIGDPTSWFDQYEKLWKALDTKYDNRWSLSSETTKAVFHRPPPPSGDLEAIKVWFFEQMQALVTLVESGMSLEQVGVNHVILQLPEEQRKELLNGLRALLPGQKTTSFTMDMVRSVFNDTVGVSTEEEPTPLRGTLSLQVQSQQTAQNQPLTQAQPPQSEPPSRGRGGRGRSRWFGYSRGAGPSGGSGNTGYYSTAITTANRDDQNNGHQRPMWCSLCLGPQSLTHYTFKCPVYQTPAEKRQRLWDLQLCSNCASPSHQGECRSSIQECRIHPGVRHYRWLCEAHWHSQNYSQHPQNQQYQQSQNQQYQDPQNQQYQQSQNQQYQQPQNQQYQQPQSQQYQQQLQQQHYGGQA